MKKRVLLNLAQEIQRIKRELRKLPDSVRKKILFVMLFGSYAEGKSDFGKIIGEIENFLKKCKKARRKAPDLAIGLRTYA